MRYLCVHCDEKFELPDEDELRCPKCMRVHGLRPLTPVATGVAGTRRRWAPWLAGVIAVSLMAGGAYAFWKREHRANDRPRAVAPIAADVLARELKGRGVQAGGLERLFAADPALAAFARSAIVGAQGGASGKAQAVTNALRARAKNDAFVAWSLNDPREGPPLMAAQAFAAIAKDGARKQLYPLEVAAIGIAGLRAVGVPAMLVELYGQPGDRAPLDPSGRLGYFAVALGSSKETARVFDVYAGGGERTGCQDCSLLTDLEAVGAMLALRSAQRLAQNGDPALALRDADAAAKLLPSSATVRSARGAVLLANGASDLGQAEFEAAMQLRPDGPRRNNLAMLHLALGDSERAAQEVARALERQPDFPAARVTLAQIHLARSERELARAELEKAEALDPKMAVLPLTWAQFHASAGENDQAIEWARRAVQARARDPQVHLMLARLYRQAGRYDEMRVEARAALSLAPQAFAAQMRELIGRLLGPTALEDAPASGSASEAAAAESAAADPDTVPDLGRGALLQRDSKEPKLRLRDPDTQLQLQQP